MKYQPIEKLIWIGLWLIVLAAFGCSQATLQPPRCPIEVHATSIHDTTLVDNYFWLREKENPKVLEYLKAENAYAEKVAEEWNPLQDSIYQEMIGRLEDERITLPVKRDSFEYYWRWEKEQDYDVYCRKRLGGDEEVVLDLNRLAYGHEFFSIGTIRISPKQDIAAYTVDTQGNEEYTLYFKDLRSGHLLADSISGASDLEWAEDNRTVFYVCDDELGRSYQLYRHQLGDDIKDDVLLYQEDDSSFYVWISKTKSKQYMILSTADKTTSEQYWLRSDEPLGDFQLIRQRQEGVEYYFSHHPGRFFVLTNWHAPTFKLMVVPEGQWDIDSWQDFVPVRDSVTLNDIEVFENYLVLSEQWNGLPHLRIYDIVNNTSHYLPIEEETYDIWDESNPDFASDVFRYGYESFTQPYSIYEYNMKSGEIALLKETKVNGYDADLYAAERIWATALDGTAIPISLVYRKELKNADGNPCLLYGYGAYGSNTYPWFSSGRISLLDRGVIFAIAHVRGGGELGKQWHEAGKLQLKMNTFTDFIACAEHLVAAGYTTPEQLAAEGGSAGGLLMGAVANLRPDLFRTIVAEVPFVDALNTMLDETLPLTIYEYKEWGNPQEKAAFDVIRAYSPYDNVTAQAYPNFLIEGSFNDARVGYWEPAKWAAKLRASKTDNNLLLLRITLDGGHGGGSGRYRSLEDLAFQYSFILHTIK